jgi:hypothetical protein
MKFASKISSLLLISALAMTTLAMGILADVDHASTELTTSGQRPAACHAHGRDSHPNSTPPDSIPPRSPRLNYQCCLASHGAALVPASHAPQLLTPFSRVSLQVEPAPSEHSLSRLEVPLVLSADPPGTTPLRI